MEMVQTSGHLILITPSNNWFGHGFYQFSPELFFSLLNERNGFTETRIFAQNDSSRWFRIKNPKEIKRRVDLPCATKNPFLIYAVSKKIKAIPEKLEVLQSDYVDLWESEKNASGKVARKSTLSSIREIIPEDIKKSSDRSLKLFGEKGKK
ncbi:MAG: hypothetical protein LBU73_03920 [Helicobacteraceae bacterium]|nr:hypothetical protein [Helicobacteraceae bacterium]